MFSPVTLAHRYIGDPVDQLLETLPAYLGSHVLWEPRTMLGYPLAADPNQMSFYPLALLRYVPGSFDWFEIAAYAIGAFGAFGLVRATTRSTLGAIVGGLTFGLGGFLVGQAGHVSIVEPAAWVPYLFWSLTEMRERAHAARASLACVAATGLAVLAGQPQVAVDAFFFAVPYAALVARRADDSARAFAVRAGVSLGLGIACAGIALVPEYELFSQSARATFGFDRFQEFTVPFLQLPLRTFFPYALGYTVVPPYAQSDFNVGSFAEMSSYAGIATLVLAAVAAIAARRLPFVTFWFVSAIAALALATGNQLGIGWLTYHVPLYNLFRAPGRVALEFDLAIAVLAGAGIAAIETGLATGRTVRFGLDIVIGTMAIAYVILIDVANAPPVMQNLLVSGAATIDPSPLRNAAVTVPVIALICAGLAIVFWTKRPASVRRRSFLLAVVVADLGSFAFCAYWRFGAFSADRLVMPPYTTALRTAIAPLAERVLTVPPPNRDTAGIAPNLNLLWDVASLRGYTPLQLARTKALFDSDWDAPVAPLAKDSDPTLDLASVRYAIVVESDDPTQPDAALPFARDLHRWRFVRRDDSDIVYENRRALPRVWVVRATRPAEDAAHALAGVRAAGFDPHRTAFVEGVTGAHTSALRPGDGASLEELAPSRMRVAVRCADACFLVTSDTTYPGWSGAVDGMPVSVHPADEALRGVFVPSGRHEVVFAYADTSFAIGRGVSLAALAASGGLAFLLARGNASTRGRSRRSLPA